MKKSPLSMPGGSRRQNNHQWNYINTRNTTCLNLDYKRDYYFNGGEMNHGDKEFIPLNASTPNEKKQYNNNNRHVSKFRRYHPNTSGRFSYDNNPSNLTCLDPYFKYTSPSYKYTGIQYHGQNKNANKTGNKQTNISKYIDIKSILEDPWAELKKQLDNYSTSNLDPSSNGCSGIFNISDNINNVSSCDKEFLNNSNNEQFQSQRIDVSLEISNNTSNSLVDNLSDNEFGDIKSNTKSNNVSSCNVSDDNLTGNNYDKQDI